MHEAMHEAMHETVQAMHVLYMFLGDACKLEHQLLDDPRLHLVFDASAMRALGKNMHMHACVSSCSCLAVK